MHSSVLCVVNIPQHGWILIRVYRRGWRWRIAHCCSTSISELDCSLSSADAPTLSTPSVTGTPNGLLALPHWVKGSLDPEQAKLRKRHQKFHWNWSHLFELYSSRAITNTSGRVMAMEGIRERLKGALGFGCPSGH